MEEPSWLRDSLRECGEDLVRVKRTGDLSFMLMMSRIWYPTENHDILQERGKQERPMGEEGSPRIYL